MNTDLEEQEDELIALQSIYYESEEFVRKESKSAGEIRVSVELPADFTVVLKHDGTVRKYEISFLPPLLLTFELPEDYPSSSPPSFTLTCSWLTRTQLDSLSVQLVDLYQATEGAVVLFSWIQFLKEDALKLLDIHSVFEVPSDEDSTLRNKSKHEEEVSESKTDSHTSDLGSTANQQQKGLDLCGSDLCGASGDGQQNPSISQRSNPDSQGASSLGSDKNDHNNLTSVLSLNSGSKPDNPKSISFRTVQQNDVLSEPELLSTLNPDEVSEDVLIEENASGLALPSPSSSEQQPPTEQDQHIPAHSTVGTTDSPANKSQLYGGLSLTSSQILLSQILIHDASQKQKVFSTTVFDCGICFSAWMGSDCVQMNGCGHVFCQTCLREFCKVQITEGNVQGVTCPQAGCPSTPTPAQVKTLVGDELFSQYDRLLLQFTLDRMPDVIYCPRPSCSSVILVEKSSNVALCPKCHFAVCVTCKKSYHGATKCYEEEEIQKKSSITQELSLPQSEDGQKALLEDYHSGSRERRHLLEKRYGPALWATLEETMNEKWKCSNTQPCPHCYCPIEKNGGCPHMWCTQCNRSFIWGLM